MRTLGFCLFLLCFAGCASVGDQPLTAGEVVALSREGKNPKEIIDELQRTNTVIHLSASDYAVLHDEGVPDEVLNYLQAVQIDALLWQQYRSSNWSDMGAFGGWTTTRRRH
jgi:hypothetical protein